MIVNTIVAGRPAGPQGPSAPSGGGEGFDLAYAKVVDERYAPRAQQDLTRPVDAAHTVRAGDTLYSIVRARLATMDAMAGAGAIQRGITQLVKANDIRNPDRIYVGQKLDLAALDTATGRKIAAAARATDSLPGGGERVTSAYKSQPTEQWDWERMDPADAEQLAVAEPAQLPPATPVFAPVEAAGESENPAITPTAARQLALYEQSAADAPKKPAEQAGGLPDIVYKGVVGKVLDAMPIEPSTRTALQRTNTIVSSTLTVRSLGALAGLGGPLVAVAGLIWGIFSSRQINAAPSDNAKPAADPNPVAAATQTAQTRVADAAN